ncbi:MAG: hypothetical protein WB802_09975 [Candidatus Dormiibacterota bacterium]|jgi:hypothetical protein
MDTMIERGPTGLRPEPGMRRNRAERDRALELRAHIRNLSIGLAAAGTFVFAAVAAMTLPGHAASGGQLQPPNQLPIGGQSVGSVVTGGSAASSASGSGASSAGLQPPSQLPSLGQGGGVVTGGS